MLKDDFNEAQDFISAVNNILKAQKENPEDAKAIHEMFIYQLPSMADLPNFSLALKIAQLHYFMQYVHDDAHRNGRFIKVENKLGAQTYIDESAYLYEITAIKLLKKSITPPIQLFDLLDEAADSLAVSFSDERLSRLIAEFPHMTTERKLDWSEALGYCLFEFVQDKLQMPMQHTFSVFQDNPDTPFVKAAFIIGKTEDDERVTFIKASSLSLNQCMHEYMFDMCHEHLHSMFDQMATLYSQDTESFKDHPYKDSFTYAWAISHTKELNRFVKSVYGEDREEMFCNGTSARFVSQLLRFTPSYQITHQPLLDI